MLSRIIFMKTSDFWDDFADFAEKHIGIVVLFFFFVFILVVYTFYFGAQLNEQDKINRSLSYTNESLNNTIENIQYKHKEELRDLNKQLLQERKYHKLEVNDLNNLLTNETEARFEIQQDLQTVLTVLIKKYEDKVFLLHSKYGEPISDLKRDLSESSISKYYIDDLYELKDQYDCDDFDTHDIYSGYEQLLNQFEYIYATRIKELMDIYNRHIRDLETRMSNLDKLDMHLIWPEFEEITSRMTRTFEFYRAKLPGLHKPLHDDKQSVLFKWCKEASLSIYKLKYIFLIYPDLEQLFAEDIVDKKKVVYLKNNPDKLTDLTKFIRFIESANIWEYRRLYEKSISADLFEKSKSNLEAIPYMAQVIADYETYGLEKLAEQLDWGYDEKRLKKVKAIREIRQDAMEMVAKNKEAQYQLAYLLNLFPNLEDVLDADFNQLPVIEVDAVSDYDRSRDYLSKEEYQKLSTTERNQLALDRYMNSHSKTKWQIGRDYELYVGYQYSQKGYDIDYFGSYMGLEDLGRDLIAKKDGEILIIQCKYWSKEKQIHEKHITQLYGTVASYCIEHDISPDIVSGLLITNIELSDMAKKMAAHLKVSYIEKYEKGSYPCIKCNINYRDGEKKYIYHLPFDQQYDSTKIDQPGEFFAETVAEAEAAGFRRAFKWFGSN